MRIKGVGFDTVVSEGRVDQDPPYAIPRNMPERRPFRVHQTNLVRWVLTHRPYKTSQVITSIPHSISGQNVTFAMKLSR